MKTARTSSYFFAHFMTSRQFLTRRALAWLGGCSLAAILPVVWLTVPNLNSGQPIGEVAAISQVSERPITVIASRLDMAGPECLTQSFTGVIKPKRSSMLAAKEIGRIDRVFVDMGDRVDAGSLLVQLDHATMDAERQAIAGRLATAEAQLAELRVGPRQEDLDQATARVEELKSALALRQANLQRNERLIAGAAISKQEYDDARYGVDMASSQLLSAEHALSELKAGTRVEQIAAAEANVRSMQAELQQLDVRIEEQSIVAPFAGTIQSRQVDEGAVVSPGQALVQIVETGVLEVHVGLPLEMANVVTAEQMTIDVGGNELACEIDRLSPAVNEATRTRDVVLKIMSPPSSLVLGSPVQVRVRQASGDSNGKSMMSTQSTPTFWVPRESLSTAARGLWAVMIARPIEDPLSSNERTFQVERRQVELLRAQGEWAEVRGPISAEEHLITHGVHRVTPGQFVVLSN